MENKDQQWALEWSPQQNCFHIQPLAYSLASVQQCFIEGRQPLYTVLMVGPKDACHDMAASWRPRIRERELLRA